MPDGTLEKLQLVAYETSAYSGTGIATFVAMVNPSSYRNTFGVEYVPRKELGSKSESPSFKKVGKEEVSFDLVLDGTGVITQATENVGKTVAMLIQELKTVVYKYQGEIHQPNFVEISWGNMGFRGRLTNMSIDYKMFSPGADPLRANVSLSFSKYMSVEQAQAEGNDQSPDMTHIITIKSGDSLPQLCQKIYGKSEYYLQVARINHLTNFRNLIVGSELFFPPLK